jgi:hypothetical protein
MNLKKTKENGKIFYKELNTINLYFTKGIKEDRKTWGYKARVEITPYYEYSNNKHNRNKTIRK